MPRWVPNALTLSRIALVPFWLWLAVLGLQLPVVALLIIIGATDMLDGLIARRFHVTSNLGATLDAVADKLATFVAVTFLCFSSSPQFTELPVWLWVALLGRDVLLGIGWVTVWLKHRAVRVEHRWHGRLATLLLFADVVAACAGAPSAVVVACAAAVVALALPGTVAYVREGFRQIDPLEAG